jgi:fructose-1,6-bisphosphatase I/sedoheptulose-1,7-bisphosphatase
MAHSIKKGALHSAMPLSNHQTLTHYLIEQRRRFPHSSGELNALILDVSTACKAIAREVALGALAASHTQASNSLVSVSNDIFMKTAEWSGHLGGMTARDMELPRQIPQPYRRGKYLLVFDALDGSPNIDVNAAAGSIFSILRTPPEVEASACNVAQEHFLQPGRAQVVAGYALYGPATMLVLTVGNGVDGFTLDTNVGEFKLTHPGIRIPQDTSEFAIHAPNSPYWEAPVKRYVDECVAGTMGPRAKDFSMRWIASLVVEAHRILLRGGVFLHPRDAARQDRPGLTRLLHEANPIAMLIEQAGGRASTGHEPVLAVGPASLQQRIGLVFGSRNEVERIERYHAAPASPENPTQLVAERSVFLH